MCSLFFGAAEEGADLNQTGPRLTFFVSTNALRRRVDLPRVDEHFQDLGFAQLVHRGIPRPNCVDGLPVLLDELHGEEHAHEGGSAVPG
jgi:hypothetical protein